MSPTPRPYSIWDGPRCLHTGRTAPAASDADGPSCRRCGGTERNPNSGRCSACDRRRALEKKRARPDRYEALRARQKYVEQYGLEREQAEVALVNAQGGLCDCCGELERLEVDHAHRTGERDDWRGYRTGTARGMVCRGCNVVLGAVERGNATRSPRLPRALRYLARSGDLPSALARLTAPAPTPPGGP